MENRSTFICLIYPTRPGFVEEMLPEEEEAMKAHAAYLQQLLSEKTLFLAGPCIDRAFGVSIFEASSLEAARQIMGIRSNGRARCDDCRSTSFPHLVLASGDLDRTDTIPNCVY